MVKMINKKIKKGDSEIIGFMVLFVVLFSIFLSSYYFIQPLLEKSRSKTTIKEIEYNLIQLAKKLSKALETRTQQFYVFPVIKGRLSVCKSCFGFYYFVEVPYSPYIYSWYDIINQKGVSLDLCQINTTNDKLINCLAENGVCKDLEGYSGRKICTYPMLFNVSVVYKLVPAKALGINSSEDYYVSERPSFRVVNKNEDWCSLYEITLPGKRDKIFYYITCNILKKKNTCFVPFIEGSGVLTPVSNRKIVISYEGDIYIPNFPYFGCSDAYIRKLKIEIE